MTIRTAALLVFAGSLAAEPPIEQMKQDALLIAVQHTLGGKSASGSGSGFPVDEKHLVTNWHVCCDAAPKAQTTILVVLSDKEVATAKPILISAAKDLAILELDKPHHRAIPALAPVRLLKEGQDVWASGYPGASLRVGDAKAAIVPSISKGIVSKFFAMPVAQDLPPVSHIQVTAAVNPGNSGGPLFDECGNVAGIVVAKAMASLGKTQTFAEGVNLAIQVDELTPELDRLGIRYTTGSACSAGAMPMPLVQYGALGAAVAALLVSLNKRTRQTVTASARRFTQRTAPMPPPSPSPMPAPAPVRRMMLRGVSGPYAGQLIPLSAKPCVLGRDPQVANLVFPADSPHISKRHCQVTLDASGRIVIEDSWSSNGTFTGAGQRVAAGQSRELKPGDRFYLGSPDNSFEVVSE
ncbi:MAG: trypsin-like peptidase domain-containing protein [Bryobacteraceae bacterium]